MIRRRQGERLPLAVWCRDGSGTPAEPDQAPVALIYSGSDLVRSLKLPIQDRYRVTGFFLYPLLLDGDFTEGFYRVVYQYLLSGTAYGTTSSFEVVAGGHTDGAGVALYHYRRPTSDFVLIQGESGRIIRKRNPRIA